MKKIIYFLIIALMVTSVFVSCDSNSKVTPSAVDEGPKGTVEVTLAPALEKNITSTVNKDIKYWEFMARPDFTLVEGEAVYGVVSYWKDLPAITTTTDIDETGIKPQPTDALKLQTNIGRYTSGSWLFEVRALNSNHHVIAIGQTRQILREGINNTVNVVVYTDRADGTHGESADQTHSKVAGSTEITPNANLTLSTNENYGTGNGTFQTVQYGSVHLGFLINRLDNSLGNLRLSVYSQKVNRDNTLAEVQTEVGIDKMSQWTVLEAGTALPDWYITEMDYRGTEGLTTVGDAKLYYEITIPNRDAGPYIYTIKVEGQTNQVDDQNKPIWTVLGGQAVDVVVVGGETTKLVGTLLPNDYVVGGLKITAPGYIVGSISSGNHTRFIEGEPGSPVSLAFNVDANNSAEAAQKYYWFINGVQQNNLTSSVTFDCPYTKIDPEEPDIPANRNYQYGIYRISCSPTGSLGSIGTQTIDVIFNPPNGANVGEFDFAPYV